MDKKYEEWLRSVYIIMGILFTLNLTFCMFNIIKYVYPMKERSALILSFYALVLVLCSSHIIMCVYMSIYPAQDPFIYSSPGITIPEFTEWLGSCSILALGWLVTATMFQLTISIREIFNLITHKWA